VVRNGKGSADRFTMLPQHHASADRSVTAREAPASAGFEIVNLIFALRKKAIHEIKRTSTNEVPSQNRFLKQSLRSVVLQTFCAKPSRSEILECHESVS